MIFLAMTIGLTTGMGCGACGAVFPYNGQYSYWRCLLCALAAATSMRGNYDAIILDIMIPHMDGIQVLQRLRQAGIFVPVMMPTVKAEREDRILGFDSGADDYLPKPFDPDELISRLRAMRRDSGYQPQMLSFAGLTLDSDAEINVVWVNISNIRKKFEIAWLSDINLCQPGAVVFSRDCRWFVIYKKIYRHCHAFCHVSHAFYGVSINILNYISTNADLESTLEMICENQGTVPAFPQGISRGVREKNALLRKRLTRHGILS